MSRFGFCGPSYQDPNITADNQRLLNMYLEADSSGSAKASMWMLPTPGTALFGTLPDINVRAEIEAQGRMFAVCGEGFYEVFSDGTSTKWGAVANDGLPASLIESNVQVMIASGQHGYCFTLATNAFVSNPANLTSPLIVQYIDGFFLSLKANSNQFQYSTALDGTSWDALNVTAISVFGDKIVTCLGDHREFLVLGNKRGTIYYDSGNTFTFDVIPGSFMEQGGAAAFCRNRMDNTFFWLGNSERGHLAAWRAGNGYQPQRVSNHAIEAAWRGYSSVSDAVSYSYGFNGHEFWRINFPSANSGRGATWEYDAATQNWHELCWRDPGTGLEWAHRSQCHCYCFGKHLVGDQLSGNIYELNDTYLTDAGNPIKRQRVAPHIANEGIRIFHRSLQIDMQMGLGPNIPLTDGAGNPRDPQIILDWSDDSGKTWSQGRILDCGQQGEYTQRAIARQLGNSRDRLYRMTTIDPFPVRITDAYLDAAGWGPKPTQRLADRMRQQA